MPVTLQGWAGDGASPIAGRKPLQALIALSGTGEIDGELSAVLAEVKKSGSSSTAGSPFWVAPVVEGRAAALVTRLGYAGPMLWTLDIKIQDGPGDPWPAGVNLIHIRAGNDLGNPPASAEWDSSTFATVIVPATQQKKGQAPGKPPQPKAPNPSRRGT
jgi:hypothetical protein